MHLNFSIIIDFGKSQQEKERDREKEALKNGFHLHHSIWINGMDYDILLLNHDKHSKSTHFRGPCCT